MSPLQQVQEQMQQQVQEQMSPLQQVQEQLFKIITAPIDFNDPTVEEDIKNALQTLGYEIREDPEDITGGTVIYSKNNKNEKIHYTHKNRPVFTNKTVKVAGKSILGKCHVSDLSNGNVAIILGRRRYHTKYFNLYPKAKEEIRRVAEDPIKKNKCIAIARDLDEKLKNLKISNN